MAAIVKPTPMAEALTPYIDALGLLKRELQSRIANPPKTVKRCGCSFSTCTTSDGGSWERAVAACLAKGHETIYVAKTIERREETLRYWLQSDNGSNMDFSPAQVEKMRSAVAHLIR